jgi:hypothetical protein
LAITSALRFTLKQPPSFGDKFWQIRDLISTWNEHMRTIFSAAWVLCLDESMLIWFNQWTCPGWVFCPCKPHPFGNEYHTACCGLLGIMFSMEMVEGKDHPPQVAERWSKLGKTMGLLLQMLATYFSTGQYVILDSGFCVLKSLVELKKVGIFACAVIKNAGTGWRLFLVRQSTGSSTTWDWGLVICWQFRGSLTAKITSCGG